MGLGYYAKLLLENPFALILALNGVDAYAVDELRAQWSYDLTDPGMTCEVMFVAPTQKSIGYLLAAGGETSTKKGFSIQFNTTNQFRAFIRDGVKLYSSAWQTYVPDEPTRCGFVWTKEEAVGSGSFKVTKNGVVVQTVAGSAATTSTLSSGLAFGNAGGYLFAGSVYYGRFWRRALTGEELLAVSGAPVPDIAPDSEYRVLDSKMQEAILKEPMVLYGGATIVNS